MRKKGFFTDVDRLFNELFDLTVPFGFGFDTKVETGLDHRGEWKRESYVSKNGEITVTTVYRSSDSTDNSPNSKINKLNEELSELVEKQDFEQAAKVRDKIKSLKENNDKIVELQKELESLVSEQNYERAAVIRDELKLLT